MSKWIILDRDGVINEDSDEFIKSAQEWRALPGSLEAIAKLNAAAYRVVVISNQSGLARDLLTEKTLGNIHQKMLGELADKGGEIARIYYCPHGPDDNCDCRKPLPGLFEQFATEFHIDLSNVYAVGDSLRDIESANTAGALAVLVRSGKGLRSLSALKKTEADDPLRKVPVFDDLAAFTDQLLSND